LLGNGAFATFPILPFDTLALQNGRGALASFTIFALGFAFALRGALRLRRAHLHTDDLTIIIVLFQGDGIRGLRFLRDVRSCFKLGLGMRLFSLLALLTILVLLFIRYIPVMSISLLVRLVVAPVHLLFDACSFSSFLLFHVMALGVLRLLASRTRALCPTELVRNVLVGVVQADVGILHPAPPPQSQQRT